MPVKFSIDLNLKSKVENPSIITPDILHGFLFSLFPKNIAENLHKLSRYKPFCIWAPKIFKFYHSSNSENKEILKDLTVTISFLKDEFFSPFLFKLTENRKNLFLGPYKVSLLQKPGSLIKNDEYITFEDFLNMKSKTYLYFQAITPISFKKGQIDYPLPDPKIFFKSLINKWNYFSPFRIEVDLRKVLEEKLCIVYSKIRTYKIKLSLGSAVTGFKGKVVFYGKGLTDEELKWLNILGHFSRYAGVGRKSTMGLGMVEFQALNIDEIMAEETIDETNLPNWKA
jgi:CRISPR-associated endoribonuclease Cas6